MIKSLFIAVEFEFGDAVFAFFLPLEVGRIIVFELLHDRPADDFVICMPGEGCQLEEMQENHATHSINFAYTALGIGIGSAMDFAMSLIVIDYF